MDQAHEQVAHLRRRSAFIEQSILAMQHRVFQCAFDQCCYPMEHRAYAETESTFPVVIYSGMALPRPEFGSTCFIATALSATRAVAPSPGRCAADGSATARRPEYCRAAPGHRYLYTSAQFLQHIAALVGEVRGHLHKLPLPCARQLASRISAPSVSLGVLRDSASHIWRGARRPAVRCLSTSRSFRPHAGDR